MAANIHFILKKKIYRRATLRRSKGIPTLLTTFHRSYELLNFIIKVLLSRFIIDFFTPLM